MLIVPFALAQEPPVEGPPPLEAPIAFVEVGGAVGTPAGLNFVGGYAGDRFGLRVSGMYLGALYGLQAAPGIHFGEPSRTWHGVAAVLGHSYIDGAVLDYVGAAYQVSTRGGFFLEAGLVASLSPDFTTPQLCIQIGGLARIPANERSRAEKQRR